ncbi:epoxyqueuosine reductase QueH [Candidatus Saccharibacteria bacterium]|nr:epoxyqueuosine reductase QueH [Candidatus Saccharibacteria bacterium]
MKLLLHTCCAPCSVYCIKKLREEKIEPTLFWYNPNIHPYSEYKARRDCLKSYAKEKNVKLILEDQYGLDEFLCGVLKDVDDKNLTETLLNRCQNYCYPKRLRKVFEYAKENGYNTVSTTLLYSIYQQHDIIKDLMEHLAKEFGIKFLYRDFREGWKEGQEEARSAGLYIQKYCGCVFSEEESMMGREMARKLKKQGISPTNQNVRKIIGKTDII